MQKLSMLPTLSSSARASQYRSLEATLQKALGEVADLRNELAQLKEHVASLEDGASGAFVDVFERPGHLPGVNGKRSDPDFDWEKWARETKARIRGEHLQTA